MIDNDADLDKLLADLPKLYAYQPLAETQATIERIKEVIEELAGLREYMRQVNPLSPAQRCLEALTEYADPMNWSCRCCEIDCERYEVVWVGFGQGPDAAREALEDDAEDAEDNTAEAR